MDVYIPQCTPGARSSLRRPLLAWGLAAATMLLLLGLIMAAPLLRANGQEFPALAIYGSFGNLCHQIPERSFHVAGHAFAVCARCLGLFAGLAVGILAFPLVRSLRSTRNPARIWLFIAAVPTVIDFSLGFLGVWPNTHLSRFMTGMLLGAVAAFFIMPGLIDLSRTNWRQFFKRDSSSRQSEPPREALAAERNAPSDYSWPSSRI
ncbi:MAG: DUF2085 domain-containing protein [Pyrinomonadaceae bacterium]|nr:DUF2085 domain-containing protein [Pyrinomonadaceae bacterium]